MAKNRGEVNRSGAFPMDRTRGLLPCHSVDRETLLTIDADEIQPSMLVSRSDTVFGARASLPVGKDGAPLPAGGRRGVSRAKTAAGVGG
jgi:hypothetical protein